MVTFTLENWESQIYYKDWGAYEDLTVQSSGDYIFRQKVGQFQSNKYSKIVKTDMTVSQEFGANLNFRYCGDDKCEVKRDAVVRIRYDTDKHSLRFDVDLDSLPQDNIHGYEIISKFSVKYQND